MKRILFLLIAGPALIALTGLIADWDLYTIATIATILSITIIHLYFQVFKSDASIKTAAMAYEMAAVSTIWCFAVPMLMPGINTNHRDPRVSVFYNGTCDTMHYIKHVGNQLLFFDGNSYSFIHRDDITAIISKPGCVANSHPPGKMLRFG